MPARTLMVQGTASAVGKSLLVTALCSWFRSEGLLVAPFKAQNMSLNAAVTRDGLEIGRAQAVQAHAAGVEPTADMNPILLKPAGERGCQVIVLGKSIGHVEAADYAAHRARLCDVIAASLGRLRAEYDVVVIEGAGSPAEVNLRPRDLANMHVAELADAPVLLAGDIDRGGVFAAFVGTLALLEPSERARVAGFVINKFRGDRALLQSGLDDLHERTGKPVVGVVPYVPGLRIADEDSLSLEPRLGRARAAMHEIEIAVVRLPHMSNHDDFAALEHEPGVVVRFVEHARDLAGADLAVVPGTKSTIADLTWLREHGFAAQLEARVSRAEPVLGICGGCQMLGETIDDPAGAESDVRSCEGLGLLPLRTRFTDDKRTTSVRARAAAPSFLTGDASGAVIAAYEIHMGHISATRACRTPFAIETRNELTVLATDGAISDDGVVVGTMLHGLFDNASVRASLLAWLRARRGVAAPVIESVAAQPMRTEYDRLERAVRSGFDRDLLWRITGLA